MRPAEYFENQILHYLSGSNPNEIEMIDKISLFLDKSLPFLPREMRQDLLDYYVDQYNRLQGPYRNIKDQILRLTDVVALFTGDYNDQDDSLTKEEWTFIRDLVSDFAVDLDEKFLTEVMSQVVSRGYI